MPPSNLENLLQAKEPPHWFLEQPVSKATVALTLNTPLVIRMSKVSDSKSDCRSSKLCGDFKHFADQSKTNQCGQLHLWFSFLDPGTNKITNVSMPGMASATVTISTAKRTKPCPHQVQILQVTLVLNRSLALPLEYGCVLNFSIGHDCFSLGITLPPPSLMCPLTGIHTKVNAITAKHIENLSELCSLNVPGGNQYVKTLIELCLQYVSYVYSHTLACDACALCDTHKVCKPVEMPIAGLNTILESCGMVMRSSRTVISCEELIQTLSLGYLNYVMSCVSKPDVSQFLSYVSSKLNCVINFRS